MESTDKLIEQYIHELGLPPSFLHDLLGEDDWSFVIKLHALFEAALASLIAKRLKEPSIENALARLEFGNTKSGKIAFAKALDLIGAREESFLRGLSELRNRLIHDISNVKFDLVQFIAAMDKNQKQKFQKEFGQAICALENGKATYDQMVLKHPKGLLSLAAYACLFKIVLKIQYSEQSGLVEALLARQVEDI